MSDFTYEDVEQILAILRDADFDHLELQIGDFRLVASRDAELRGARDGVVAQPLAPTKETGETGEAGEVEQASGAGAAEAGNGAPRRQLAESARTITAPMVGTFYSAPQPGAPPFVEVGQEVGVGETVGLIEAMKMFTAVTAGVAGRVEERLVENGAFVEYGEALFVVDGGTSPEDGQ